MSALRHEPQAHVCPLCAAPVAVESGWDGAIYLWNCDHEAVLQYDEPRAVSMLTATTPEILEELRKGWCAELWASMHQACEHARGTRALAPPGARYFNGAGFAPKSEGYRQLRYTAADRRLRHRWRRLSSTAAFSETLKSVYLPKIKEHLNQGSVFLAAVEGEMCEATIDFKGSLDRQTFDECGTVEGRDNVS